VCPRLARPLEIRAFLYRALPPLALLATLMRARLRRPRGHTPPPARRASLGLPPTPRPARQRRAARAVPTGVARAARARRQIAAKARHALGDHLLSMWQGLARTALCTSCLSVTRQLYSWREWFEGSLAETGRFYLGVSGKPRKLWTRSCISNELGEEPPSPGPLPRVSSRGGTGRRKEPHDCQAGPADHAIRFTQGLGDLARRTSRDLNRAVAQDRKEGVGHRHRLVCGSSRSGPLLRVDRRLEGFV
jgi:hypothetical protein